MRTAILSITRYDEAASSEMFGAKNYSDELKNYVKDVRFFPQQAFNCDALLKENVKENVYYAGEKSLPEHKPMKDS